MRYLNYIIGLACSVCAGLGTEVGPLNAVLIYLAIVNAIVSARFMSSSKFQN